MVAAKLKIKMPATTAAIDRRHHSARRCSHGRAASNAATSTPATEWLNVSKAAAIITAAVMPQCTARPEARTIAKGTASARTHASIA